MADALACGACHGPVQLYDAEISQVPVMQLCTRQAGHIAHKPLLLLCLQPWGAPLPMPLLPCTAGRHTEYPVYSIPNTGCRPANSSSWINLPHQNFMYRIFVTTNTKSWWSWKAEAALYGGILYVPRSRKEQVGGGCFLEQRLPSVRVWRLRLKAGGGPDMPGVRFTRQALSAAVRTCLLYC